MPVQEAPEFRLFRPDKPAAALGLAVNHLMTKPAFANLKFGDWSRILVGQINRGHFSFAVDRQDRIEGFVGWAFATREKAEGWAEGRPLSYQDSLAGDCIVFNAWSANSNAVHRFLVDEARKLIAGKETMYFRRHYPDGGSRVVRLSVNDFVAGHIRRRATSRGPAEAADRELTAAF
ncbi:toxin-activating lysine-acyltransferase [Enterovirga rhinocerotis]|uniref:Hemolysin-activating ACP:hemolysin acyltransferase n=1 Tax=Enterovirga rhinocerotis TaxID=1339210 RepID=A0A4R7CBZ3_9HYPH|nr:toxin-activating lysine-acyltransferase [Enterovirga rhinocerotis]TDR94975.1 hemolysin-activating ACP:hemolysin acyltransferase [Enterovirga rhinocerotis]